MNSKYIKIICVTFTVLIGICSLAYAGEWTEDAARKETFRDIKRNIEVWEYPAYDPQLAENQMILKQGGGRVADRFVSKNPEPPIGYLVSKIGPQGPAITMFYANDGRLMSVRLFSRPEFPRSAYTYCVADNLDNGGKIYRSGELMSVSFHVAGNEMFYFSTDGKLTDHVKF